MNHHPNDWASLRGHLRREPSAASDPDQAAISLPDIDTPILAKQEIEEIEQLDKFIDAYEWITGERLENLDRDQKGERPDFICGRCDGTRIGIELTEVPHKANLQWDRVFDPETVMSWRDLIASASAAVFKKEQLRSTGVWRQADEQILVVPLESYKFDSFDWLSNLELQNEFNGTGFTEIWLCDNTTLSAHGASQLIGLFPARNWGLSRPPGFDPKPYG